MLGEFGVYRVFDYDGALIYVGASRTFKNRMHGHAGSKPWRHQIDETRTVVEWFDTVGEASERENYLIATERPRYNVHGQFGNQASKYSPRPKYVSPMLGMTLAEMKAYLDATAFDDAF